MLESLKAKSSKHLQEEFEGQLTQSLISQETPNDEISTDVPILTPKQEEKQKTKNFIQKTQNEGYSEYQIPPSLEIAKRYWDCTGIGKLRSDQKYQHNEGLSGFFCTRLEQFLFKKNPLKIRGLGSTIPLFFLFIKCCLCLLPVQYFSLFYLGIVFRKIYCRDKNQKGKECTFFDLESYKVPNALKIIQTQTEELQRDFGDAFIIFSLSIFVIYAIIFWFSMKKVQLRFACKDEVKEGLISEFTIMVEKVDGNDARGLKPVHQFIDKIMKKEGFPEPKVVKTLLAKPTGKIGRAKKKIRYCREEVELLKRHIEEIEGESIEDEIREYRTKNLEKLLKPSEDKIINLENKIKIFEKTQKIQKQINKNSIAFISYRTNIQRDQVLMAYNHQYSHIYSFFLPRPLYKISPAKQPASIIWDNVGHSRCDEILRFCIARPLIFLLIPIFILTFIVLNSIFQKFYNKIRENSLGILISLNIFIIVKIFSFFTLKAIDYLSRFEMPVTKDKHGARKVFLTSILKSLYLYLSYSFLYSGQYKIQRKDNIDENNRTFTFGKIFNYLLTSTFLVPLLSICQFKYFISEIKRWVIETDFKKQREGTLKRDSKYFHMTQKMLNDYWERPDVDLDSKYTLFYSLIFLNSFFGFSAPLIMTPLIFLVIVMVSLIMLKLIYSRYKKPDFELRNLGNHMIRRLIIVPKTMTLCVSVEKAMNGFFGNKRVQNVIFYFLAALFLVNFDFVLNHFEKFVERRCMSSPGRTKKLYSDNSMRFDVDYEIEYLGLKKFRAIELKKEDEVTCCYDNCFDLTARSENSRKLFQEHTKRIQIN